MMSCVMKLCVVLLNQIKAADVKTQHTDVSQFLVLTGFISDGIGNPFIEHK